ncbi:hypothetical protein [Kitasatospora sp. NPDC002040]|uniref:hypothetical protein n=1 Tax=Kitasatospora sp. NPDC002040 TaxID=3154661 RepID=UPI00331846F4
MSTNRSRRIDRAAAEHLLAGAPADPSAGQDRLAGRTVPTDHAALAGLIASAAAPAVDGGELPGEQAALTAFRTVRDQPAAAPRRRTAMAATATARARAFSAKALLAACAATALGGVAFAASTGGLGHLPGGLGGGPVAHAPESALAKASAPWSGTPSGQPFHQSPTGASSGAGPRSARPEPSRSASAGPAVPSATADGTAVPTPAPSTAVPTELERLCQAYGERLAAGDKAKALLADPRFAPLLKAAGGADDVREYCDLDEDRPAPALGGPKPTDRGRPSETANPPTGHQTREGTEPDRQ